MDNQLNSSSGNRSKRKLKRFLKHNLKAVLFLSGIVLLSIIVLATSIYLKQKRAITPTAPDQSKAAGSCTYSFRVNATSCSYTFQISPLATPTPTPSPTPSPTPTIRPTATPTPTPAPSPTPTIRPTATPSPTPTALPTPSPTATPLPPMCLNITPNNTSPKLGDQVHFTCGTVNGATYYQFQYSYNSGTPQNLPAASTGSNISSNLTFSQAGHYQVQCQACNSAGCSGYESW